MLGVPAQLAGCPQVVLCTPPRADGTADPAVLVAARLTGVQRVFKLGGAQAIAAMAYGTASIPACDKLFGPGNSFVTEAKQQVAQDGAAAIDMPAGPSEVLVIADAGANPAFVAADLLSQAEHGPDSQVLLLTDDAAMLAAVEAEVERQVALLPRQQIARQALSASRLILVDALAEAFAISNRYAPEHLILALREPRAWLDKVQAAGSVFLGITPRGIGRLLQRHQPRAAHRRCRARLQRCQRGQFPEPDQRAERQRRRPGGDWRLRAHHRQRRRPGCPRACGGTAHGGGGMSAAIEDVLALVRPDLQAFAGYSSRSAAVQGEVWLNANESAWANPADAAGSSRRYPEPQPLALREGLAAVWRAGATAADRSWQRRSH